MINILEYIKNKGGSENLDGKEVYVFRYSDNIKSIFKKPSGVLIPTKVIIKYNPSAYFEDFYLYDLKGKTINYDNHSDAIKEKDKYVFVEESKDKAIECFKYLLDKRIEKQEEMVQIEAERLEKIKNSLKTKVK